MSEDKNSLVYREQLDDNVIEMLSEDIGSNYSLRTENQRTIVAALNEIHGKDIISNAVGSPLLSTDTFNVMGEKINGLTANFKTKLLGLGVSVSDVDKIESLISKMDGIDLGTDAEELLGPLADSLGKVLSDEGVELSGEETLAELIIKVDEEFDRKNTEVTDLQAEVNNKNEIIEELESNQITVDQTRLYQLIRNAGYDVNTNQSLEDLYNLLEESSIGIVDVKQISDGYSHTFILKNDGSLWACGYNNKGQLGLGTVSAEYEYRSITQVTTNINNDVKQVACGTFHAMILKNDGSLWACGDNQYGQLGLGDTTDRTTFTQVTNDVKQVACNGYCSYTFILKNDGSVWACGLNEYGQLGLGDTTDRTTFTQVTTNINNDVKEIVCGDNYTFILKNDGSVWACGRNEDGQLGLGDNTNRTTFTQVTTNINNDVKQVACGECHTFILKNDGSVWSCGLNYYCQLGYGTNGSWNGITTFNQVTENIDYDVKDVSCGDDHTIIMKNDGTLWGCGYNEYGQLGLGNVSPYETRFVQVGNNITANIKQINCGFTGTSIITEDNYIYFTGYTMCLRKDDMTVEYTRPIGFIV